MSLRLPEAELLYFYLNLELQLVVRPPSHDDLERFCAQCKFLEVC